MTKDWLRLAELVALTLVAVALITLAAYMVYHARLGEAFGAVITTVPLVVQAIRNIGSAQAMNAMAEYLAKSTPPKRDETEL